MPRPVHIKVQSFLQNFTLSNLLSSLRVIHALRLALLCIFTEVPSSCRDVTTVSSFYGPGAIAAWLVLAFQILINEIEGLWTPFNWLENPQSQSPQTLTVDTAFLAFIAYPIIVIVDYWIRWQALSPTGAGDCQYEASRQFIRLSGIITSLLYTIQFFNTRTSSTSRKFSYLAFFTIHTSLIMSWIIHPKTSFQGRSSSDKNAGYNFKSSMFQSSMGTLISYQMWASRRNGLGAFVPVSACLLHAMQIFTDGFHFVFGLRSKRPQISAPFPRTGSRFGELDQATAFGIALAVAGLALYKQYFKEALADRNWSMFRRNQAG